MENMRRVGAVGEWLFWERTWQDRRVFAFTADTVEASNRPRVMEWYGSIEHAMAAAIAEKHTGPRGACGTGVGTAADWFMRMIGADR